MRNPTSLCLSLPILLLSLAGCGGDSGGSDPSPHRATHNQVLSRLGIGTDLPADRVDLKGDPVSDNPLGATVGALKPACEIFWMNGGAAADPKRAQIHEDGKEGAYKQIYTLEGDLAWTKTEVKNAIGADVDGDGFQEIVVAYLIEYYVEVSPGINVLHGDMHVKVVKKTNDSVPDQYTEHDEVIATRIPFPMFAPLTTTSYLPTLAKGDLDDDDRDEIVIGYVDLYVLDLSLSGYPFQVKEKKYASGTPGLFVAAGDLDECGRDEIAVTSYTGSVFTGMYANLDVLQVSEGGVLEPKFPFWIGRPVPPADGVFTYQDSVNVAIGDIDRDGRNEMVFHGRVQAVGLRSNDFFVTAARLADTQDRFESLDFYVHSYGEYSGRQDGGLPPSGVQYVYPTLALLDFDGDGSLEIFARNWLWRYREQPTPYSGSGTSYGKDDDFYVTRAERLHSFQVGNSPPRYVAVADVNGDHKDDLVYTGSGNEAGPKGVEAWVRNSIGEPTRQQIVPPFATESTPRIGLANMDADSTVVQYTGSHELLFSDVKVVAVLACPPYHAGIGQTNDLTGTTIGMTEGQQTVEEQSLGVSVGFSVGVELEDDVFTQSKFAAELRGDMESGFRIRTLAQKSETIAYSSGAGEDKVIFTAFPFDVYYYRVISPGTGSDLKEGGTLTISIPRTPQIVSVSRAFYNANNGDYPDIDKNVLGHTIGDVWSYPRAPHDSGLWSTLTSVGQGNGYNTRTIDISSGLGAGDFANINVDVSVEVGAGGVVAGYYEGYQFGYSYEVTNTRGTFYQGLVNNIPPNYSLRDYDYSWGICAYPFSAGSDTYTVVNYWVAERQ